MQGRRFPVNELKLKELVKMSTFEAPEMEFKMDYIAQFVKVNAFVNSSFSEKFQVFSHLFSRRGLRICETCDSFSNYGNFIEGLHGGARCRW